MEFIRFLFVFLFLVISPYSYPFENWRIPFSCSHVASYIILTHFVWNFVVQWVSPAHSNFTLFDLNFFFGSLLFMPYARFIFPLSFLPFHIEHFAGLPQMHLKAKHFPRTHLCKFFRSKFKTFIFFFILVYFSSFVTKFLNREQIENFSNQNHN